MSSRYQRQFQLLSRSENLPLLKGLRRGIEKESLRVATDGMLAQTGHPHALGSALTHPMITTDFAEPLLEFITPVATSLTDTLAELDRVHRYTYRHLDGELLWPTSMPCVLGGDDDIPVARYGRSNAARMKTLYRIGLGHRYGRHMQTIAGIHYNFSVPDELWPLLAASARGAGTVRAQQPSQALITERYFDLIRNFRRWSWLLLYLFGASPAMCRSFLDGRSHQLAELDGGTLYLPHATSLRMGDLGYQSSAQEQLEICYNSLDNYIQTLKQGILQPHAEYEKIGVKVGGEYRQLSASLLQIENEFYSTIRPKRVSKPGETPLAALAHRGVEYIEVRCLDLNPFHPLGIDPTTARFLDAFLLYCLLADSPECDAAMRAEINANQSIVVNRGREPGVMLGDGGVTRALSEWGTELLEAVAGCASLLDQATAGSGYAAACAVQRQALSDPAQTPSARVLAALEEHGGSFSSLALQWSEERAAEFRARPLPAADERMLADEAAASLARQRALEATEEQGFDDYLQHYFEQYRAL